MGKGRVEEEDGINVEEEHLMGVDEQLRPCIRRKLWRLVEEREATWSGKWKQEGYNHTVEGEWKNGQLHSKPTFSGSEYLQEFEAKDGKNNGS